MAQGTLWYQPIQRMFAGGTNTVPNAKAYFFLAGTSTPTTVYADVALTIPLTQPVIADANGVFPEIFLTPGVAYKVDVQTSAGVSLPGYPADNQIAIPSSISPTFTGVAQDFRLSLATNTSVTTSDVVGSTLFFTPHIGRRCTVFDSTGVATTLLSPEISLAVPATTNQMYDVFVWNNGGTLAAELLAWTNDTTRAVGVNKNIGNNDAWGIYTKAGDLTRRYVGSVRTTATSGQVADTAAVRGCWNYYNRVPRALQRFESVVSWSYTISTVRQANANPLNQVEIVIGLSEVLLDLTLEVASANNVGTLNVSAGIGENSTTTYVVGMLTQPAGALLSMTTRLLKYPAMGRNVYSWNEWSQAAGTTLWFSSVTGVGSTTQSGLTGSLLG